MNDDQLRANVQESMKTGAAAVLRTSKLVSQAELLAVVRRAKTRGSEEDWAELVDCMSKLVASKALTYYRKWKSHLSPTASFDDIFNEGLEGLHHAAQLFDESRGYAFTTYADQWIRNRVQRAVYAMIGAARIPERQIKDGIAPTAPLVAGATLSLDWTDGEGGRALHEELPSPDGEEFADPDVAMMRAVYQVLAEVDIRLPRIVELLQSDYAYREIGRMVGISADRVRQLHAAGERAVLASGLAAHLLVEGA